jgi:hypothetical protein
METSSSKPRVSHAPLCLGRGSIDLDASRRRVTQFGAAVDRCPHDLEREIAGRLFLLLVLEGTITGGRVGGLRDE